MTATLCSMVFLAQSALGCGWGGHHDRPLSACCDVCGVESAEVFGAIQTLQCHPRWRKRDNAANDLRDFDWRCHPEILGALSFAMLTDCEEEVREEAAQSLAKIDPPPCTPDVHAALDRSARCDPDHATRKQARRALKRLGRHCIGPCSICGPATVVTPLPTEVIITPPSTIVTPGTTVLPPSTLGTPEPRFEMDGLEPLPPPLPPGAVESFEPLPETRRSIDDRISARSATDRDLQRVASRSVEGRFEDRDTARESDRSSRRRPRLFPFSILNRRGR